MCFNEKRTFFSSRTLNDLRQGTSKFATKVYEINPERKMRKKTLAKSPSIKENTSRYCTYNGWFVLLCFSPNYEENCERIQTKSRSDHPELPHSTTKMELFLVIQLNEIDFTFQRDHMRQTTKRTTVGLLEKVKNFEIKWEIKK